MLLRQVVTLLDPKEPLLDPPPVLEPPLLEPLEPSLPLPDQLEMLDPLLVEVDLDLLLLLRCWSSLPLDLSVGSAGTFFNWNYPKYRFSWYSTCSWFLEHAEHCVTQNRCLFFSSLIVT
jgi:hypothetical protein